MTQIERTTKAINVLNERVINHLRVQEWEPLTDVDEDDDIQVLVSLLSEDPKYYDIELYK